METVATVLPGRNRRLSISDILRKRSSVERDPSSGRRFGRSRSERVHSIAKGPPSQGQGAFQFYRSAIVVSVRTAREASNWLSIRVPRACGHRLRPAAVIREQICCSRIGCMLIRITGRSLTILLWQKQPVSVVGGSAPSSPAGTVGFSTRCREQSIPRGKSLCRHRDHGAVLWCRLYERTSGTDTDSSAGRTRTEITGAVAYGVARSEQPPV